MPKVSIVVPVYNAEKYIKTTVDSILSQTFSDWELLLIDDCSKDNTPTVCRELTQRDSRIIYLRQTENGGPARVRNIGIDQAKGEYLAFVDSDDTVEPNFLERLLITAEEYVADIVWCNYKEICGDKVMCREHRLPCNTSISYDTYIRFFFLEQEGLGSMCTKLYRKSFINQNKIRLNIDRVHGEDWEFNMTCFKCHPVLVAIESALYNYVRQNNSSVIASYRASDYQTFVMSNKMKAELARKEGISYDKVAMNSKFVHLVIELLLKLKRSGVENKKTEFYKIVNDDYFRNVIETGFILAKGLPLRFKLYFFLIKFRLTGLAYIVM